MRTLLSFLGPLRSPVGIVCVLLTCKCRGPWRVQEEFRTVLEGIGVGLGHVVGRKR
jgi:hypothetical protein